MLILTHILLWKCVVSNQNVCQPALFGNVMAMWNKRTSTHWVVVCPPLSSCTYGRPYKHVWILWCIKSKLNQSSFPWYFFQLWWFSYFYCMETAQSRLASVSHKIVLLIRWASGYSRGSHFLDKCLTSATWWPPTPDGRPIMLLAPKRQCRQHVQVLWFLEVRTRRRRN